MALIGADCNRKLWNYKITPITVRGVWKFANVRGKECHQNQTSANNSGGWIRFLYLCDNVIIECPFSMVVEMLQKYIYIFNILISKKSYIFIFNFVIPRNYIYIYIYIHIYIYIYIYMLFEYIHAYIYAYIYLHIYVYIYIYFLLFLFIYIYYLTKTYSFLKVFYSHPPFFQMKNIWFNKKMFSNQ